MYLLPEEPLDSGFDTNRTTIFPSNSPVTNLEPVRALPSILPRKKFGKMAEIAMSRFKPLMKIREKLNEAHLSDDYFQTHYPEADSTLKHLLHEQTINAWGNALNSSSEVLASVASDKKELGSDKSISVTITIQ